ncbi:MAG TPA: hypothetical protein VJN43_10825 [Bryobacteraceae bacterium]|nr:hypothetical protein [Bryobacteraceae bacterium]
MADEQDPPRSEAVAHGICADCELYEERSGRPALRRAADLAVALACMMILLFAIYFSEVDSDYTGSRRITTAIQQALGIQRHSPPHAAAAGAQGIILVAVRDDGLRLIAKTTLEHYGYTVLLADNPNEAVSMFREPARRVVLVLVESSGDAGDGGRTIEQFKRIRPGVPILRCSARADAARENLGARDRIDKPFTATILAAAVRDALGRK